MKAFLTIESRVFQLNEEITTMGRGLENTLVLDDKAVSRHHAKIVEENEGYTLFDLQSSTGTFLNGEQLQEQALLKSGDKIFLADTEIVFYKDISEIDLSTKDRTGALNIPDHNSSKAG